MSNNILSYVMNLLFSKIKNLDCQNQSFFLLLNYIIKVIQFAVDCFCDIISSQLNLSLKDGRLLDCYVTYPYLLSCLSCLIFPFYCNQHSIYADCNPILSILWSFSISNGMFVHFLAEITALTTSEILRRR